MPDLFDLIAPDKEPDIFDQLGSDSGESAAFDAADEQQAMERRAGATATAKDVFGVIDSAVKLPGKVAMTVGFTPGAPRIPHWPTDEEVSRPLLTPTEARVALGVTSGGMSESLRNVKEHYPQNPAAQVAGGISEGVTDAVQSFSSPENVALMPVLPTGGAAGKLVAGVFLGQAIRGTPAQWQQLQEAPALSDKIRIATAMGLGYALPALGLKGGKEHLTKSDVRPPVETEPKLTTQQEVSAAPIKEKEPSQMTPEEWRKLHFDESEHRYLPSDYFDTHSFDTTREATKPIKTVNGIEFRADEYGGVHAFDGDKNVGYGDGKAFVVAPEYQKRGIGTELISITKADDPLKPIGSKTAAGDALIQAYHRRLVQEASLRGEPEQAPSVQNPSDAGAPLIPKEEPVVRSEAPIADVTTETATRQNEPTPTSTKNEITAKEREARGIVPAEETARREFGEVWKEAEQHLANDPDAGRRLVAELAEKPRALTDKENAILLRRQIEAQNEHDAAVKAVNEAKDDASRMDAATRLERARDDVQAVYDAGKAAGTETGRGLNARKMLANDDFSLAKMEATTRAVVNDGKPLTPKQAADVAGLHERIRVAERRLAEYETRERFQDLIRDAQKEARARKASGKTHQKFLEERAAKARERIKEMPGVCAL